MTNRKNFGDVADDAVVSVIKLAKYFFLTSAMYSPIFCSVL